MYTKPISNSLGSPLKMTFPIENLTKIRANNQKIRSHDTNAPLSIFERTCNNFQELLPSIILGNQLKSFVALRAVSLKFYELFNVHCLKRIVISFNYSDFSSPYFLGKLDFAHYSTGINIIISSKELYGLELIYNSIQEDRAKITLIINDINELEHLEGLLLKQSDEKILHKIIGIELKFDISDNNVNWLHNLLAIISQRESALINFKSLILGKVSCDITFTLPTLFTSLRINGIVGDSRLALTDSSNNLETLSIKFIRRNSALTLASSFKNLLVFTIGPINNSASLFIADEINNLKMLMIGNIDQYASLKLPTLLNNLNTFTIGNMYFDDCDKIELPTGLNNLKNLAIGDIYNSKIIFKPDLLDNLTTLKLGTINKNFILPDSLPNLETLTLEKVDRDFKWPTKLYNLTSLYIGHLNYNFLTLPNSFGKLITLKIGNIDSHSRLTLPDSLDNLEVLIIGDMGNRKFLEERIEREKKAANISRADIEADIVKGVRSAPLYKRKTTIGNAILDLPHSMNKLTTLTLGDIDSTAIITSPSVFNNLKTIKAGIIENDMVIKQLESIKYTMNADVCYKTKEICCCQ